MIISIYTYESLGIWEFYTEKISTFSGSKFPFWNWIQDSRFKRENFNYPTFSMELVENFWMLSQIPRKKNLLSFLAKGKELKLTQIFK